MTVPWMRASVARRWPTASSCWQVAKGAREQPNQRRFGVALLMNEERWKDFLLGEGESRH